MSTKAAILKTKFFLPQPTSDFIERKSLNSKFENLKRMPLMLISASTGYGKSTLITSFLLNQTENYTWLSLSDKENEFKQFIRYFIRAIQIKVQNFGEDVLNLADSPQLPPVDDFAELFANNLTDFDRHFYMVLDDYHFIKNEEVHQFLAKIFEYPSPFFRLIIITRRDPELPLPLWRSKGKLAEIRSSDLKFDRNEIAMFFKKAISYCPNDTLLHQLEEVSDGWIAGLRMLTLTSNNGKELQQQFSNFKYKKSFAIQQMVTAVLKNLPTARREMMLKLSIVKEFNVELFSELCLNEFDKENKEVLFREFTMAISRSNMFIIALDDKHNWFRFHHMFLDQLSNVLLKEYGEEEIIDLRKAAANWYSQNDLLQEAILYYLDTNQVSQAIEIFTEYRLKLISETRFWQLECVYNLFPEEVIDKNGILLVTKGWLLLQKGNIPEMAEHINTLEQLLQKEAHPQELLDLLVGEIHSMKAFDRYLSDVDIKACLEHSKKAITLLKDKNPYALGIAWVYYGAAMQHLDQSTIALKDIYKKLETCINDILKGQLLLILCFLEWFEGNLISMLKTAEHLLQFGNDSGISMCIANGNILLGIAYYYQNNDEKALKYLLESHKLRQYTYLHMSFATGMALASIYAKTSKVVEKDNIILSYETTALKQGGILFIKITKSTSADLAWRYQNEKSGLKWAQENDYRDFLPMANLFSPELVQARILVLDDDPASHRKAQDILNITIPFFEDRNDVNILIRSYVIQALLYYKFGDLDKAFETLQEVLNLSCIGHYVRPYIELGESMKSLLQEYNKTAKKSVHIDEIIQNFQREAAPVDKVMLSVREKEILILAEKMTNKEIGNQLFIAEKTVKTHITNINRKLNVINKHEALTKAKELEIF